MPFGAPHITRGRDELGPITSARIATGTGSRTCGQGEPSLRAILIAGSRVGERWFKLVDMRCLVAGLWADVGESSGVNVSGDTTSERSEASPVDRHGGRVELESLG